MRISTQNQTGDPNVLQLADVPKPAPGAGQVLVKVGAAGVNPVDLAVRAGYFKLLGEPPFTLGWDVAGIVEEVGDGVEFARGDEVLGLVGFPGPGNAYAEYAVVEASEIVRKPAGLSVEEAAALPLVALTAWQALVGIAKLEAGQRVLIHRAAGGVGHLAVQIAKARGTYVIGTASAGKHDFVRGLGADELIDYRTEDFTAIDPVDVAFDLVGGDYAERTAKVVKPGGLLVGAVGSNLGIDIVRAAELGIRFEVVSVRPSPADLAEVLGFKVTVEHALPLADVAKAHELVASGRTTGKVVLVP
ncbi:NADPH:quinone reductase [Lentzea sp. NBRC 105346]|uniref:NADP-dependent oxidoreductase n=1 Tax=Lentzea sp. NBRC 105346 TaxID=3032205 RepID=UPI0024A5D216|nr:NADP-dependent oxidoreductase [Lentzea sp. NBRC 105346]GLZ29421.1 NADPH:quinone reductase [Lentzea sp. NBRC 105346]